MTDTCTCQRTGLPRKGCTTWRCVDRDRARGVAARLARAALDVLDEPEPDPHRQDPA